MLLLMFVVSAASLSEKQATPWNRDSVVSVLEWQASVLYARGARLLNDVRLLYEIRSLLREPEAASPGAPDSRTRSQEPAKTCSKRLVTPGRA